jgi:EAL domain-containing protein (putative c-di-GMP-specific phosphodiesterase class I)/GGDEF domain-containing protein
VQEVFARRGDLEPAGTVQAEDDAMRTARGIAKLADLQAELQAGRDVEIERDLETALRDALGRTDHVTLLPNRRRFIEDVSRRTSDVTAEGQATVLVLVTLAEARQFNEILRALGHAYAEEFVRMGSERLRAILPTDMTIYHVSVLSFAFLAPSLAPGERPECIDRIVAAFLAPLVCQGIPIDSSVGVGLTVLDASASDPSEILRATLAAAQDSRAGTDGWSWYNRKSDAAHRRAFQLLSDLKPALEGSTQLFLDYQPRVDMQTGACVGVEALVRWNHPQMGLVSPAEFIPLAEATALVTPLTRLVIARAVEQQAAWRSRGIDLRMSVNVSPKNLMERDFVDYIVATCADFGVLPSMLEIEFTEGTLTTNNKTAMDRLRALKTLGVAIAIDDFGSGYSNMSYLTLLPAQTLKIDQSFVRPLDTQPKNAILLRAIIDLGHKLGYRVVAEGIETQSTYNLLAEWGCDEGQGYWMSRPLGVADLPGYIARSAGA